MKRLIPILLLALLLSGCSSWSNGEYHHVTPHVDDSNQTSHQNVTASDYVALYTAIDALVERGAETGVIFVGQYDRDRIEADMVAAADVVRRHNPMAAYAVEQITCELGTNSGQSAVAVKITYNRDPRQLMKIRRVENMEQGTAVIADQLDACADSIVLYCEQYRKMDLVQFVEDYAAQNPQLVMETPQVTVDVYPEIGTARILEVKFTYQTSRETLRSYQTQVGTIFYSAEMYVAGDAAQQEKYSQLYSFLMQRHNYVQETSITPAYSLLKHGKGDAKTFATVYAAMCRRAGLECLVVTGTRWSEAWYWNLICDDGVWYHVDLLRCSEEEGFAERVDVDMEGYVWDYEAYPQSVLQEPEPTEPVPTETTE